MKTKLYILLFPVFLSLCGCGLYSNYNSRPLEYNARNLCSHDSISQPISAISWRELFTDSYLVNWIDSGLNRNTDLRIAQMKVDEAAATLTASRLAFLPSVNISADGSV